MSRLRHSLLLALPALVLGAPALAQNSQATDNDQDQPTQLEQVVVTGTRALGRTVADSLAPIDILTPQDLKATGATSLTVALRTLLPSLNFPQPSLTDATDATKPAQLRGLSPDHTLVLINGKRQHTTAMINVNGALGRGSSPVDLSAIPMVAIDHIEVLRDGAAAQYGSDAIAGVINIILKGGTGGSANVSVGQYDGGQGFTWQAAGDTGFALGDSGWIHVAASYKKQDPTNHAGPDIRYPGDPTYNTVTFHYGLARLETKQAAVNMKYSFSPQAELYGFTVFNQRTVHAGGFFRAVSGYKDSQPAAYAVYPEGFRPIENSAIRDDTIVFGLRGDLGGWRYDLSAATGGSHWKLHTTDTFNYSLGAASPTHFYIGTLTKRQNLLNLDFSKSLYYGDYSMLTIAWGAAYRHEEFTIKQGDPASYFGAGAQVYPGYQPLDAGSHSRNNKAVYVDLEADFTRQFSAGLAARYENYSDFGSTASWKLSGRYAFNDAVAVRGTASTGFRAPSLQQQYYSSTSINFINVGGGNLVPFTVRTFPVSDPAAIALGARPLEPETSRNLSLGLVLTADSGLYATFDFYQVEIDDRIILSGNLVGDAVRDYLTSVGIPYVSGGRFFTNAVDTRTRGLDVVATYPMALANGQLKWTAGLNWNKTEILSVADQPPQLGLPGLVLPIIDRRSKGFLTDTTPRTKLFVGADWSSGPWSVRAQVTRYGEWTSLSRSDPANDQTFDASYLLNASASYGHDGWRVTLGARNLTNHYPERNSDANNYHGILTYPLTSPYGFNGVYYYARANFSWD